MKKRVFSVVLSGLMAASLLAGCGNKIGGDQQTTAAPSGETEAGSDSETETPEAGELELFDDNVEGHAITTALADAEGGEVDYDVYSGVEGKDYTDEKVYTYRDTLGGTTGLCWSPMNWETNEDSQILDYITSGLYSFALNPELDGWSVTMEMATEPAEDVTADYVGQYGIEEGDVAKAFKFKLNELACWEDGTPINADTFIYSYRELLDPHMKNRRADSLYAGEFAIYNAKNYFYDGQASFTTLGDMGYSTIAEYLADGGNAEDVLIDAYSFRNCDASYTDADGNSLSQYVSITDETVYGENVEDAFSGAGLYNDYFAEGADYESEGASSAGIMDVLPAAAWDEVGIFKTGDYEIVLVTVAPIDSPALYVPYNLSSTYLVYEPLWESCKSYFDANGNSVAADSDSIASVTTNYGTSVDTTMSYGPYKLTYFELDKSIKLARNDNWYGYKDGLHLGQYQTDEIDYQIITEHETGLLAFLNGEIDSVSLQSQDMEKYGTSDYIRYEPQSYTTKLTFNTNPEALKTRGTEILTSLKFRKAFSLAVDRNKFASSYTAAGSAGYGMLNYMYVYDPFTGATYRDTDAAKGAICDLYGLTYGDDGDFEDVEEAYDAVSGYDLEQAKQLMKEAYEECKAAGIYNDENVEIQLDVYNSDDIYVQMFNYLNDSLKAACEGSGFEGKVSMKMVANADYYETMYSGNTDMIFTTWGGSPYSPYTLLYECYCDAADGSGNQMEYGFDTSKIKVSMDIDGTTYTASLQDWAKWADSAQSGIKAADGSELKEFNAYDAITKSEFFANLEYAYLANYVTTPIYYRNVGMLVSQKGDYAVQQYVDLIGFGGLAFYTYNYDDAEWETVKASGLTY